MRTFTLLLSIFLIASSFNYGSGTAYLTCKSESGRTLFKAEIEDIESTLQGAELTIDGKKLVFTDNDNSHCIFDAQCGVYTIFIESDPKKGFSHYKFLKFWTIPSTFKTIINTNTHQQYEFRAKLYASEPRKDKELQTPTIEVVCSLEYKI